MISIQEKDGVGHIVLERSGALNALNREFCRAIDDAARTLDRSASIHAILISSSLKHFCAGADIREMAEMKAEEARSTGFIGCVEYIDKVSKPVIVAVNGLAAGGGCELVEMCDIIIAGESARFCHPEITLAAMPGAGGTQRLTRAVGKHVALDMLLTGRALNAREALAAGLVSRVVGDSEVLTVAREVATQIATFSSPVATRIKASVLRTQVGLEEGLARERESFHVCFDEDDFREGLSAFMAKRKAQFIHR
jgi:enoyl-CoA hydratase